MTALFHSIRSRAFTGFGLLFAITLLLMEAATLFGVPGLALPGLYQQALTNELNHLADVARGRAGLVLNWVRDRRSDLDNLSRVGVIHRYLTALDASRNGATETDLVSLREGAQRRMEDFVELSGLRRVALIDLADGADLGSAGVPCTGPMERAMLDKLIEKARKHEPDAIVSQMRHNVPAGRHCLLLGRVIGLGTEGGRRVMLMLAADVQSGLSPGELGSSSILHGDHGEVMVLDQHLHALSGAEAAHAPEGDAAPRRLFGEVERLSLAALAEGDEGEIVNTDYRGVTVLAAYRSIAVAPGVRWGLVVKRDRDQALAEVYQRLWLFVIFDLMVLLVGLLLVSLFTRRLIGPIESLAVAARRIEEGDLTARAVVQDNGEIARLALTFNAMAGRIEGWRTTLDAELAQRTTALRESEERYGQVFLRSLVPQFLIDPAQDGLVVDANQAAVDFYGYPLDVFRNLRASDVTLSHSTEELREQMVQAVSGERSRFEFRHRLASGEIRDVEVFSGPVRMDRRDLLYAMILDISERRRAEQRLRAAERLADFGHWEWDIRKGLVLWSPVVARQFGLAESEVSVPLSCFLEHIHPDDQEFAWARVEAALKDPSGYYENEFRIRTETGADRYLHTIGEVRRDARGEPVTLLGTSQDVTARRQSEEALRRLAQRNRALMESALDGVLIARTDGVQIDCNQRACELLRIPREQLLGRRALQNHPEHAWPEVKRVFAGLAEGNNGLSEHIFLRGDGTLMHGEISATLLPQDDGEPLALGVFRDVTERYERESALQAAKQAADVANQAKSAFLSAMSHELRTPLNAIIGHAQLLERDRRLPDEARDKIHVISRSGDYLLTLISDVLDISKIEAGRLELQPHDFDLRAFFEEVVHLFQLRTGQKGLAFRHSYGFLNAEARSEGFPVNVRADEKRLRQVLLNLLSNAVKFTDQGEISLDVVFTGAGMRVSVRDTGRGIDTDDLDAIFEPFRQVGDQSRQEGTGLGLPICRKLVRMMGGRLEVQSRPGAGALFSFEIPLDVVLTRPASSGPEGAADRIDETPGKGDRKGREAITSSAGLVPPPANVLAALWRLAVGGQLIPLTRQIESFRKTAGPEHQPFCDVALGLAKGFRIKELRSLLERYR